MSFPDTQEKINAFQSASVDVLKRLDQQQKLCTIFEQHVSELTQAKATLADQVDALSRQVEAQAGELIKANQENETLRRQNLELANLPAIKKVQADQLRQRKALIESELARLGV